MRNKHYIRPILMLRFLWILSIVPLLGTGFSSTRAQIPVRMNEIMYAPIAPEPEWIELFNPGISNISLTGWQVLVKTKKTTLGQAVIPAGGYLVLTKDSLTLRARHTDHAFSILQLPLPSLANAGDELLISDNTGTVVDSLHYYPAWGGSSGTSVERISITAKTSDSTNWGSSVAPEGSTPGLLNSLSPAQYDLAIRVQATLSHDTLVLEDSIMNRGSSDAAHSALLIYRDDNHDSSFTSNERIDSVSLPNIPHGTSLDTILRLANQPSGNLYYEAKIELDSDQVAANDTAVFGFLPGSQSNSIVLNEIMYAPTPSEPEWIELYNRTTDSLDIAGYSIRTSKSTSNLIPVGTTIAPASFLILTKDDSTLRTKRTAQTSIATIIKLAVPDLPNGGGTITLLDARGSQIDSLVYLPSWGGASGKSLERIDADLPAVDSTNLAQCVDTSGATLGLPNSVRKRETDLELLALSDSLNSDGTLTLRAIIYNLGKSIIDTAEITVVPNNDRAALPYYTAMLTPHLGSGEMDTATITFPIPRYGVSTYLVSATSPRDSLHSNDTLLISDTVAVPFNGLAINEIMLSPIGPSCQWIELYNTTHLPIETSSLWIDASSGASAHYLGLPGTDIPSSSFAIVAADSTHFYNAYPLLANRPNVLGLSRSTLELTTTAGNISIRNNDSTVIDSFSYSSAWLPPTNPGISLERISRDRSALDSTNWLACVDPSGATPLEENSVSNRPQNSVGAITLSPAPNPFSPDGDGIEDNTTIGFTTGSTSESTVRLRVFDMRGRLVRTLLDASRVYLTREIVFDGKSDSGTTLGMGVYTLLLDCTDGAGNTKSVRTGVVIAKRVR